MPHVTPWEKELQEFLAAAERLKGRPLTAQEARLWIDQAIALGELGPAPPLH